MMDMVRFRQNPQNRRSGNGYEVARMKAAVVKETSPGERRVALVPDAIAKLRPAGIEVLVESGAGNGAWLADSVYADVGASIASAPATYRTPPLPLPATRPSPPPTGALTE